MRDPWVMIEAFVAFILALSLHECGHAIMARLLGDETPARNGQLSLSPRRHLSTIGTLVAIASSFSVLGGIGWGKPLDFDVSKMRVGANLGTFLVGFAGLLTNAVVGGVLAVVLRILPGATGLANQWGHLCAGSSGGLLQSCLSPAVPWWALYAEQFLMVFAVANILLALVNLIPCAPLDGYTMLFAVLPDKPAVWLRRNYGIMEFLLLVFFFLIPAILGFARIAFDPSAIFAGLAQQLALLIAGPGYAFYSAL